MDDKNRELLTREAKELGVEIEERKVELIDSYLSLLKKWNQRMNLTGLRDEKDQIIRLILDSLAIVPTISEPNNISTDNGASGVSRENTLHLLDLGSGAGIPGIPVKIARPDATVVLAESRGKKATFLREAVRELGLPGLEVHHGRAEEIKGRKFDYVLTKAFGDLAEIAKLSRGLLKIGGIALAMKGPEPESELEKAKNALEKAGFRVKALKFYDLPDNFGRRSLVILEKTA